MWWRFGGRRHWLFLVEVVCSGRRGGLRKALVSSISGMLSVYAKWEHRPHLEWGQEETGEHTSRDSSVDRSLTTFPIFPKSFQQGTGEVMPTNINRPFTFY